MDILDVLEEIKDINAQQEGVSFEQLIEKHLEKECEESSREEQTVNALTRQVNHTET